MNTPSPSVPPRRTPRFKAIAITSLIILLAALIIFALRGGFST